MAEVYGHSGELRELVKRLGLLLATGKRLYSSYMNWNPNQDDSSKNKTVTGWSDQVQSAIARTEDYFPDAISILASCLRNRVTDAPIDEIQSRTIALERIISELHLAIEKSENILPSSPSRTYNGKINFDTKSGAIYRGKTQEIKIRERTLNYCICQLLFLKRGKWVEDKQVIGKYDTSQPDNKTSDIRRPVYDAVRKLNDRIQDEFGVDNFIEYNNRSIRISPHFL